MRKINRETVQRILDAVDIVDVVSDFVTLRRRGANYIGLCPFHNERTPSFSVSKAKGICKCFSCGKGGSAINFLMELESMSYQEALRYLAKKYNIEVEEHEMTDAERIAETERESMLAVNKMAMDHFAYNLVDTQDGRNIGLAYFRERGISDEMIKRFHLGYALEDSTDLYNAATRKGYSLDYLLKTGLCSRSDSGRVYDRFRGRVIYPVLSVSGKVVAFGGRTLRKDKSMAKYVNSPESLIYSKRRELYGLYHSRQAIVKADKCILVEGYMDVISMHQAGVENVVASSGTSLTAEQVRLIHRFTNNITVIYDADAAGVKASLRSIDMLLLEGMNIKVLSLPPGEDPDSFAQTHSSSEVEEYIKQNEIDFIRFKVNTLLRDAGNDPLRRAQVINDIVKSISLVADPVARNVYITTCSHLLGVDDKVVSLQVNKLGQEHAMKLRREEQISGGMEQLPAEGGTASQQTDGSTQPVDGTGQATADAGPSQEIQQIAGTHALSAEGRKARFLLPFEKEVIRLVLKYGMVAFAQWVDENENVWPLTVYEYINGEMSNDGIKFETVLYARALAEVSNIFNTTWQPDLTRYREQIAAEREEGRRQGIEQIRTGATNMAMIESLERELEERLDREDAEKETEFAVNYVERILASSPDDDMRRLTADLVSDRYVLSKVHTKYSKVLTELDRLTEVVPRAIHELKAAIIDCEINLVKEQMKEACKTPETMRAQIPALMTRISELNAIKQQFAHILGERIIIPR
ncbi:MAG: DNA primase [Muribaculaceae bacterium]|nr:DNA primase [Muribaculaceae bacterium]